MHPILFHFGPATIRTYGLLLALGFALAIAVAAMRAKNRGIERALVLDVGFWSILSGIIGARVFYVIQFPGYYLENPLRILKIWEGGLIYYGGLLVAVAVSALYLWLKKAPLLAVADLMAPSIALGQGVGRLGCLAAGCCYGLPFSGPCAVTYHSEFSLAPLEIPLHPVQIYLSAADFGIMGILLLIDRRPTFRGQIFATYFILYAAARFGLEFLRGDARGSFLGTSLSPAQGTGIIVFILGAVGWIWLKMRSARPGE